VILSAPRGEKGRITVQDRRALVLTRLVAGKVDEAEAALLLGLSPRSIRRLKARYIERGPASLSHGNRGRRPAHALDPALAERVVGLAKTTYAGCNDRTASPPSCAWPASPRSRLRTASS